MCATDPPSVCMVLPFLDQVGGMERQAVQLAAGLHDRGIAVSLITGRSLRRGLSGGTATPWPYGPVYAFPVARRWRVALILVFGAFAALRLRAWRGLIHAHQMFTAGLPAAWAGRRWGQPVIVKVACGGGNGDVANLRRLPFGQAALDSLRSADRLVALSGQISRELVQAGFAPERIVQIPNGVDVQFYHARPPEVSVDDLRRRLGLPSGRLAVFAGRLEPEKSVADLLQAWPRLLGSCPDAGLAILGDGPQRQSLEAQSERLGLSGCVVFKGNVGPVRDYLWAGDVFVLPSRSEGISNALLEAMAVGLPPVVTSIGGNVDLVADGVTGLTWTPGDGERLAAQLASVLADRDLAETLARKARAEVCERFSMSRIVSAYEELYAEVIAEKGR